MQTATRELQEATARFKNDLRSFHRSRNHLEIAADNYNRVRNRLVQLRMRERGMVWCHFGCHTVPLSEAKLLCREFGLSGEWDELRGTLFYACVACIERFPFLYAEALPARRLGRLIEVLHRNSWKPALKDTGQHDYPSIEPPTAVADVIASDLDISDTPPFYFRSAGKQELYTLLFEKKGDPFTS